MPNLFKKMVSSVGPAFNGQMGNQPAAQPLLPSWMRTGFEGGVDTALGALGVGPDTRANRLGNMIGAGSPFMMGRTAGPLSRMSELINPVRKTTSAIDSGSSIARKMMPQLNPILDESGRFLGFHPPANPAFDAHVASSRNKLPMPKGVNQTGTYSSLAPSQDQMERIMNKYKK